MDKKLQQMQAGFHTAHRLQPKFGAGLQASVHIQRLQGRTKSHRFHRTGTEAVRRVFHKRCFHHRGRRSAASSDSQRAGGEERERTDTYYQLSEFQRT